MLLECLSEGLFEQLVQGRGKEKGDKEHYGEERHGGSEKGD